MELKWLGIGMVMFGSVCTGLWYRLRYLGRLTNLRECQRALTILRGEIQYGRTPLPEACREVERRIRGAGQLFFRQVAGKLCEGKAPVEQIWQESAEEIFSSMQMKTQEREEWIRLGSTLGYLDVEMQLRSLDLYLQHLQTSIDQASAECRSRTRLYPLLGTFCGVLICLVLV